MPSDREKLTTTTKIRDAKGLTPDSYVPKSYLNNTLTILKASSKFKRNAKERRKRLLEEQAERELEQAGSIWTQQRQLEEEATMGAASTSAQQSVPSQGQPQIFVPAVQANDNTKLEDQIGHLTAQVSQLHTLMRDLVERESRRAESGGLAFRMP
jgi:hypothetical protein